MNMAGVASSCGACKFLRRKCSEGCVFAPYFSYDEGAVHFAAVHKVFGASNVSKLLSHLPAQHRSEAAVTISYEAQARMKDPVYGCVSHIFALQQQVASLQEEIESLTRQLVQTGGDDPNPSRPSPDGIWDCFQVCRQEEDFSDQRTANASTMSSFNGENKVQGLHAVYRDAIERLEYTLFSDIANEASSWEELPSEILGEFAV